MLRVLSVSVGDDHPIPHDVSWSGHAARVRPRLRPSAQRLPLTAAVERLRNGRADTDSPALGRTASSSVLRLTAELARRALRAKDERYDRVIVFEAMKG